MEGLGLRRLNPELQSKRVDDIWLWSSKGRLKQQLSKEILTMTLLGQLSWLCAHKYTSIKAIRATLYQTVSTFAPKPLEFLVRKNFWLFEISGG